MTIHKPQAYGAVLGSIAQVGFSDITIVGFTSKDNHGFPSKTHVNGINGDFRYLKTDQSGESLHIDKNPKQLDVQRQEQFIDALNNFGWAKFYSVEYKINNKTEMLKLSDDMPPHHHHLHTRLFEVKIKK